MSYTIKKLPKSLVEIEVEIPSEEMKRPLEAAAVRLSEKKPIEGFRPGKAPYEVVKNKYGEMAIYEEASAEMIKRSYLATLEEAGLKSVAAPDIKTRQLVSGSSLKYTATVAVLPEVTLGDFSKIKIKKVLKPVTAEDVAKVLKDIQRLRASTIMVERAAGLGDKLSVSLQMFLDKVPLDGGQARKQEVILGESFYVPGFSEQLVGLKKGETKEFILTYPKDAQEKRLAGRAVEFKVEVHEVFEVKVPELNDEFAKSLGKFASVQELQDKVRENVSLEHTNEASQVAERDLLQELIKVSNFGEFPEVLIVGERERMTRELTEDLTRQGLDFTTYLQHLQKNKEQFEQELRPQAERRLKVALLLQQIGSIHGTEPTPEQIDEYLQGWAAHSAGNPEVENRLKDQAFRDYAANILTNQRALDYLKKQCIIEEC